MPELLGRLERKITGEAWTVWEAFSGFAQRWLEVEPEKLDFVIATAENAAGGSGQTTSIYQELIAAGAVAVAEQPLEVLALIREHGHG